MIGNFIIDGRLIRFGIYLLFGILPGVLFILSAGRHEDSGEVTMPYKKKQYQMHIDKIVTYRGAAERKEGRSERIIGICILIVSTFIFLIATSPQ